MDVILVGMLRRGYRHSVKFNVASVVVALDAHVQWWCKAVMAATRDVISPFELAITFGYATIGQEKIH